MNADCPNIIPQGWGVYYTSDSSFHDDRDYLARQIDINYLYPSERISDIGYDRNDVSSLTYKTDISAIILY